MKLYKNHPYDRAWAEIHLDRIQNNMRQMRAVVPEQTALCGVVKTDAYGHGAPAVAKTIDAWVCMYAVATVDEGIILRRHGITKPILVLGVTPQSRYRDLLQFDIMPTIFTLEQARLLSEQAEWLGRPAQLHLAVDTGMGRIGLQAVKDMHACETLASVKAAYDVQAEAVNSEAVETALAIAALPFLSAAGIFTHFATADETDKRFTYLQMARFRQFTQALEERGLHIPLKHCANSAGIIEGLGSDWDMMRAGISIYGVYPSDEVCMQTVKLQPAMELKAAVSYVKTVPAGTRVSYGSSFTAAKTMQLATIPVGYGDGYPRALSGKGFVLIHGHKCRLLGRVCMDQFMVDVSDLEVKAGDTATLLGQDGAESISLADFADWGGCFSYEVLCGIGKRVPRVYLSEDGIVGLKDANAECYADFL